MKEREKDKMNASGKKKDINKKKNKKTISTCYTLCICN